MPTCPKCGEHHPEAGQPCACGEGFSVDEADLRDADFDPRLGTKIGDKYIVLSQISEGGMGAVYRALQLPVERLVALKVLRTELERSHSGRKRFVREARAISRLTHPNTITLHDFGFEDNDQPFMVMEYADGQVLNQWLKDDDVTPDRIVHITRQILGALSEAHAAGIIHRDLKPQNIIVNQTSTGDDFAKLLDFGIVRLIDERATQDLTRAGEVFGTPFYMSPEQARGKKEITPAADVYAMGIMLFEFFTGELPFTAETPLQVLFMHLNEPLPDMVAREGLWIPHGLEKIIRRACSKEVAQRYADARAMLHAIDEGLGITHNTGPVRLPTPSQQAPQPAPDPAPSPHREAATDPYGAMPPKEVPQAARAADRPQAEQLQTRETSRDGGVPWIPIVGAAAAVTLLIIGVVLVLILTSVDEQEWEPTPEQSAAASSPTAAEVAMGYSDDDLKEAPADEIDEIDEANEADEATENDEIDSHSIAEDLEVGEHLEVEEDTDAGADDETPDEEPREVQSPPPAPSQPSATAEQRDPTPTTDEPATDDDDDDDPDDQQGPTLFERPPRPASDGPTRFERPSR